MWHEGVWHQVGKRFRFKYSANLYLAGWQDVGYHGLSVRRIDGQPTEG